MKTLLRCAEEGEYAIPGFNIWNVEDALAIREAAQRTNAPLLIMIYEGAFKRIPHEVLIPAVRAIADESGLPASVHLDHGMDMDLIKEVMGKGFDSVMYDGSSLPYEDNVKNTREIAERAKDFGITVEAELGHVGIASQYDPTSNLTDPDMAVDFVGRTGVDALAVAIGTAHGAYQGTPKIDIGRLKEINAKVDIPLVLHGGSRTGTEAIQETIRNGIRKLNIYTDLAMSSEARLSQVAEKKAQENERFSILEMRSVGRTATCDKAMEYIEVCGAVDRAKDTL